MQLRQDRKLWGIVLAGGEGTRVREFLAQLCGGRGIKQFCAVIDHKSMLEHTLARVERLIPRARVLVIVSQDHREEAEPQLAHWPRENVIFQPHNRDTAPGILLPLAHITQREPFATVAIFPSDHFILDEVRFLDYVRAAIIETRRFPHELTLLGVTPTELEEGYGWIEPGEPEEHRGTRSVCRFWEKPSPLQAHALLRRRALWNTFVGVAQANTLWEMIRQAAPDLYLDFMSIRRAITFPHTREIIESVYGSMREVNFSTEICRPLVERLRVLPASDVGWSDWGCERRILQSLQQLGRFDECLRRLRRRAGEREFLLPLPKRMALVSAPRRPESS